MWHTSVHSLHDHHLLHHIHYLPRVIANSKDEEGLIEKKAKQKNGLELLIYPDQLRLHPNLLYHKSPCTLVTIQLLKLLLEIVALAILLHLYITLLLFTQLAYLLLVLYLILLVVLLVGPPAPHFLLPPPILQPLIPPQVLWWQRWVD
jgi:hypothetical protein